MGRQYGMGFLCGLCLLAMTAGPVQARFLSARQARKSPRARIGCLPSATSGVRYPNPFALGKHSYGTLSIWERNGIVYTCRGGHVDITHIRKVVDWTAWLAYRIRETLLAGRTDFSFRMQEPSVHHVRIVYPERWKSLAATEREDIARKIAIQLGQYLAYTTCVWHEMLTWFGYKGVGIYPEYMSAFSWEDNYSNALGSQIGAIALRDPDHDYNEAVTLALHREVAQLGAQPKPAAWLAGKAVRGTWFTNRLLRCQMMKRHFDIGLDDGHVTPWLVPGVSGCDEAQPQDCPVPGLAFLERYGFAVRFEIEPREWERTKILAILSPHGREQRIEPVRQFGLIMDFIRTQAIEQYGPAVGDPGPQTAHPGSTSPRPTSRQPADITDLADLAARWLTGEPS